MQKDAGGIIHGAGLNCGRFRASVVGRSQGSPGWHCSPGRIGEPGFVLWPPWVCWRGQDQGRKIRTRTHPCHRFFSSWTMVLGCRAGGRTWGPMAPRNASNTMRSAFNNPHTAMTGARNRARATQAAVFTFSSLWNVDQQDPRSAQEAQVRDEDRSVGGVEGVSRRDCAGTGR